MTEQAERRGGSMLQLWICTIAAKTKNNKWQLGNDSMARGFLIWSEIVLCSDTADYWSDLQYLAILVTKADSI